MNDFLHVCPQVSRQGTVHGIVPLQTTTPNKVLLLGPPLCSCLLQQSFTHESSACSACVCVCMCVYVVSCSWQNLCSEGKQEVKARRNSSKSSRTQQNGFQTWADVHVEIVRTYISSADRYHRRGDTLFTAPSKYEPFTTGMFAVAQSPCRVHLRTVLVSLINQSKESERPSLPQLCWARCHLPLQTIHYVVSCALFQRQLKCCAMGLTIDATF